VMVSEAFKTEVDGRDDLTVVDGPKEIVFDEDGNLVGGV